MKNFLFNSFTYSSDIALWSLRTAVALDTVKIRNRALFLKDLHFLQNGIQRFKFDLSNAEKSLKFRYKKKKKHPKNALGLCNERGLFCLRSIFFDNSRNNKAFNLKLCDNQHVLI